MPPNQPLKSLSKSASGGEMSRIMLGLKKLLVKSLHLSLIIFDEIDSGVSGYVANQVAKRMKNISKETQVICITHISQVAAMSDHHFLSRICWFSIEIPGLTLVIESIFVDLCLCINKVTVETEY